MVLFCVQKPPGCPWNCSQAKRNRHCFNNLWIVKDWLYTSVMIGLTYWKETARFASNEFIFGKLVGIEWKLARCTGFKSPVALSNGWNGKKTGLSPNKVQTGCGGLVMRFRTGCNANRCFEFQIFFTRKHDTSYPSSPGWTSLANIRLEEEEHPEPRTGPFPPGFTFSFRDSWGFWFDLLPSCKWICYLWQSAHWGAWVSCFLPDDSITSFGHLAWRLSNCPQWDR